MRCGRIFSIEKNYIYVLVLMALFFAGILVWRSGLQVLVGHEMASLDFAGHNVSANAIVESNGWFYYTLVLRPFTNVFGTSPLMARMPSVIPSVLSFFLVAFMALKLAGKRASLLACLIYVIHPTIYEFATNCRFYAVNQLLCLIASCLLYYIIHWERKEKNPIWLKILYILTASACVSSQESSSFVFPFHGLIILLSSANKGKGLLFTAIIGAVLGLVLFLLNHNDPMWSFRLGDCPEPIWQYFVTILLIFIGTEGGLLNQTGGFLFSPGIFVLVPLSCLIWGTVKICSAIRKSIRENRHWCNLTSLDYLGIIQLFTLFLPTISLIIFSRFWINVFDCPLLYYAIAPMCIIMGLGLDKMPKYLGLIVLLLWGLFIPTFRFADFKQQEINDDNEWNTEEVMRYFVSPSPLEIGAQDASHQRLGATDSRIFTNNSSQPTDNNKFPYAQGKVWFYGPERTFVQIWIIDERE